MRLTNNLGLPQALVNAVAADEYSRGSANISATGLIDPPRKQALFEAHQDEIVEDASDRIYSLIGRAIHWILEKAAPTDGTVIPEKRFFMQVPGPLGTWTVSGAMDNIELDYMGCALHDARGALLVEGATDAGLLGVDGSEEKRLRRARYGEPGYGPDVRAQVVVPVTQGSDPAGLGSDAFLRQQGVREPGAPVDGYASGEHAGRSEQGSVQRATEPPCTCGLVRICDWKTAKTDEMVFGVKWDREAQLNIYRVLLEANGFKVGALRDIFILRDWSKVRALSYVPQPTLTGTPDASSYPQSQVVLHDIDMWSLEDACKYISERVALHQQAQHAYLHGYLVNAEGEQVGDQTLLPDCTDDERWASKPLYAVTEPGASKATRVLDTIEEAEAYVTEHTTPFEYDIREKAGKFGVWKGAEAKRASKVFDTHAEAYGWLTAQGKTYDIVPRPGRSTRCVFYCNVSSLCTQFKEMQAA